MLTLRPVAALFILLTVSGPLPASAESLQDEKPEKVSFANPQLLLTTDWLAEHGKDKGVVIVDVRDADNYAAAHVPGAVHLRAAETSDPESRWSIGSAKHIAELLGARGISAASHIVLYDGGKSTAAGRVFWVLEVYGHARVSVIDGGFTKWRAEKRDTTKEVAKATATEYKIGARTRKLSTGEVLLADVGKADAVMLDARTKREYTSGRIPHAVRIEWTENFTAGEVPVFKSPADLMRLYSDQGVTPDKRIHAY